MISVNSTFVDEFIKNNIIKILQCGSDFDENQHTDLNDKEKEFCKELSCIRERLVRMTKEQMIKFVFEEMQNAPYVIYWDAYRLNNLQNHQNIDFRKKDKKKEFIDEINSEYKLNIPYNIKGGLKGIKNEAIEKLGFNVEKVNEILIKMFNYDDFCTKIFSMGSSEEMTLACQFVLNSKLTCCPYCNRAFIETFDENNKRTATLDHYFPKSLYPFFAISPWNLVPCCYYCNKVKLNPDTMKNPHLYPYELKNSQSLIFKLDSKKLEFSNPDEFDIMLEASQDDMLKKAENSYNTFHLEQLYQNNKNTVTAIYELLRFKGDVFFEEIAQYFTKTDDKRKLEQKKQEFIAIRDKMIMPYGEDGMLGKLSKDIFEFFTSINTKK